MADTRSDLKEVAEYHDARRAELWAAGDQADATRHARMADAARCAANNWPYLLTPAEHQRFTHSG